MTVLKKGLSFLMALVIPFSITVGVDFSANANVNMNFEYKILDNGTAEITDYTGSEKEIVIPSKIDGYIISGLGVSSFEGSQGSKLEKLVISDGIKYIEEDAFIWCRNLTDVTLPNTLKSIGENAFRECNKLLNISFPDSLTEIGPYAFFNCDSLKSISIGGNLISIGENAFTSCDNLSEINVDENNKDYSSLSGILFNKDKTDLILFPVNNVITDYKIPDIVKNIQDDAFYDCKNLHKIEIPDSVVSIGSSAFSSCNNLEIVKIGSNVEKIDGRAFYCCSSLKSIVIPNCVTFIGYSAFEGCINLEEINIPSNVYSIGDGAFNDCINLENINVSIENSDFTSVDGVLYNHDKTNLLQYPIGKKTSEYKIIDGVEFINYNAFEGCINLNSIHIPNSVSDIFTSAFDECNNLEDVYYVGNLEQWNNINIGLYNDSLINATLHFAKNNLIHNSFTVGSKTFSGQFGYYYSDEYFNAAANTYNQQLATMSLCLASSAFNASNDYNTSDKNVKYLLEQCEFSNYSQYNYHKKPTENSIACAVASKKLNDTTLIVVAIRGGGYEDEWSSNGTVGASGNHNGFDESAFNVLNYVLDYISLSNISGNVKFWVTGYSRGAAVANIFAAQLFKNQHNISGISYTNNDVYAYCFATPAGVDITEDPHSDVYNNIFNIINYHDPVPLVAPSKWGLDRYGVTKVLPFSEGSKYALPYEESMIEYLSDMGYSYKIDDFRSFGDESLGTFLRNLINDSTSIIGSRAYFVKNYQEQIKDILITKDYSKRDKLSQIVDLIFKGIPQVINASLFHSYEVLTILTNSDQFDILIAAHSYDNAYYLAWMQSMDTNYVINAKPYFTNGDYRAAKINCPVDVYVYNNDNQLVAQIIDDIPYEVENSSIIAIVDSNKQKIVYLPCDENYKLKIIARDDCETTYTINEYTGASSNIARIVCYSSVEMKKNDTYIAAVNAYSENEIANGTNHGTNIKYTLSGPDGYAFADIDISDEKIEEYTYVINATYDEEKGNVLGGGVFTVGDFCQLTAKNNPGYKFDGWYINNEKISNEKEYRFAVKNTVTVEARFIKCQHSNFVSEIVPPNCIEQGYTKFMCNDCGYSVYDDYKPAYGHRYDDGKVMQLATCSSAGVILYECVNCGYSYTESIPSTNHNFGEWIIIKEATETEKGIKERVCNVCGEKETQIIPILTTESNNEETTIESTNSIMSNRVSDASKKSPNTGSGTEIIVASAVSSALIIAALLVSIKKKKKLHN